MKKLIALSMAGALFVGVANAATLTKYYAPGCPFCTYAKDFIDGELRTEFPNLNVVEINAAQDNKAFFDAIKNCGLSGGGVPLIVVGDTCINGFKPDEIREAVRNAPPSVATNTVDQKKNSQRGGGKSWVFLFALMGIAAVAFGIVAITKKKK